MIENNPGQSRFTWLKGPVKTTLAVSAAAYMVACSGGLSPGLVEPANTPTRATATPQSTPYSTATQKSEQPSTTPTPQPYTPPPTIVPTSTPLPPISTPVPIHPVVQYINEKDYAISPQITDGLKFLGDEVLTVTEKSFIDVFGSTVAIYSASDQQSLLDVYSKYVNDTGVQLLTKATDANLPAPTVLGIEFLFQDGGKSELGDPLIALLAKYSADGQLNFLKHYDGNIGTAQIQLHEIALENNVPLSTAFKLDHLAQDGQLSTAEATFIALVGQHPNLASKLISNYPVVDEGLVEVLSHTLPLNLPFNITEIFVSKYSRNLTEEGRGVIEAVAAKRQFQNESLLNELLRYDNKLVRATIETRGSVRGYDITASTQAALDGIQTILNHAPMANVLRWEDKWEHSDT